MKKKSRICHFSRKVRGKIPAIRRLAAFLGGVIVLLLLTRTTVQAQDVRLQVKQATLQEVFRTLKEQTGYTVIYSESRIGSEKGRVTLDVEKATLPEALDRILEEFPYTYRIEGQKILIVPQDKKTSQTPGTIVLKGQVRDVAGESLIGATVVLKHTPAIGTSTDLDGNFVLKLPDNVTDLTLSVSFIGMKTQEIVAKDGETVNITLEPDHSEMEEVVVTGYYTVNKQSFTGASKSISAEELKTVSNNNLIGAIAMLTPGLQLIENNAVGSNPNVLPEIVIRGTSSLSTDADVSPNQPLIILDGVEISLQDLYDLNINEIDRVDVLKDASATAMYGERAANGVIVIVRKPVSNEKLRLSYNLDGRVEIPDLRTYHYLNAADKLEFERLSGLYDMQKAGDLEEYNRKLQLVSAGVNTDWMAKPLRTGFDLGHSLNISGRGNNVTYRVNANYRNVHGVMKKDLRDNLGVGIFLSYHLDNKLSVSYQNKYTYTKSKNSPYGSFSQYVNMNPYDSPYAGDGSLARRLSWDITNPLAEALCGNFSKSENKSFLHNLSLRWDIVKDLYLTATASITTTDKKSENFISPESVTYSYYNDISLKGSLTETWTKSSNWEANAVLNYNLQFKENYRLFLHAGTEIAKNDSRNSSYTGVGFYKSSLHTTGYAAKYDYTSPSGGHDVSSRVGVFGNINFIAFDRYFVDGSVRRSGSSQFGANNRFAPFWSVGAGWNIHNESFIHGEWLNTLRLRYSYGVTGNVSFAPYQAITTYIYKSDYNYLHGIGAVPMQMGNDDLTWQSTRSHNFGVNGEFWKNRISFSFDYYVRTSDDMLIDLTIPPSSGESSVKKNMGKMRNTGYEFDLSVVAVNRDDWRVNIKLNGAHNQNKILHISNALRAWNDENNAKNTRAPLVLYQEGQSTTAIYAVRSAGINPANGQEIFIDRNGEYTLEYSTGNKVVCGDENPTLEGTLYPSIRYKNFSMNITARYRFGGQVYNTTRAYNVENVNPRYNVDRRAFEERWKRVNDITYYLDIANGGFRSDARHSGRFVEDDNIFEIKNIEVAYEFQTEWIRRIGLKRLRLSAGVTDPFRWSSTKYERGTAYPFSHGFSFSVSPTF